MQQEKKYMPIHDEDHDRIIKGQMDGLSLEMAIYNAGYERGKAQHPKECEWVKDRLPSKAGDYYCKCKIDGDTKKLIVEFDENGKWGEAPGYGYYDDFEIIEWLSEAPCEPEQKEAVAFAEWAGWEWRRVEGKSLWENQKTLEVLKSIDLYERFEKETGKQD